MSDRVIPFIRLITVAAIVAGAAAWAHPRRALEAVRRPGAQVCRGGVYTLIVEAAPGRAGTRRLEGP